jgi:hypothetical protein
VINGSGNSLNQLNNPKHPEAYLSKITTDGTALIMTAYLGGTGGDQGNAIALNPTTGDIYLAGNTNSYDFPLEPLAPASPVVGISQYAGNGDAFVTKILGTSFPAVTVSPSSLTFTNQTVGFLSAETLPVTLTSTGQVPLIISSITITGDFTQSNTCGTGLPAASSSQNTCTITVSFTPTAYGTRSGTLTISDNASTSPQQTVGLSGNGVLVQDSVSPATLDFGTVTVGTTSAALTVTVTNTDATQTLIISSSPVIGGTNASDFAVSSNGCTSLLTPGKTCTVGMTFTPTGPGTRSGTLVLNSANGNTAMSVQLTGIGNGAGSVGSSADFTLTPSATSVSVKKGTPATFGVTVTTSSLFTGTIQLSCTPTGNTTCTIAPTSITVVSGTTSYSATVTVNVPAGNTISVTELIKPGRLLATLLPFGGIGLVLAGRRRRWLLVLGLAVWLALGMVACGGGGSSSGSSAPQVTITATPQSGGSAQAVAVALSIS